MDQGIWKSWGEVRAHSVPGVGLGEFGVLQYIGMSWMLFGVKLGGIWGSWGREVTIGSPGTGIPQ